METGVGLETVGGSAANGPNAASCPIGEDVNAEESEKRACGGQCEDKDCSAGPCVAELVATEADGPGVLAADAEYVYFATQGGAIKRVSADGTIDELARVGSKVRGLARHGQRLYWSNADSEAAQSTHVGSLLLPSGVPVTLEFDGNLVAIGLSDTHAYLADFDRGVVAVAQAGGVLEGTPRFVAGSSNASGISVVGERVYWSQLNLDNSIRYFEEDRPGARLLVCHQQWPVTVVADDSHAYWINRHIYETDGRIMVHDANAAFPRVLLAREAIESGALAASDTHLYWVEARTNIMRLEK